MGYETKLIIASKGYTKKKAVGYLSTIATLELGCVSYDSLGDLIHKLREESKSKEELREVLEDARRESKAIYQDGEFTEELKELSVAKRKARQGKLSRLERKIEKQLPYVFNGDEQVFEDSYGDFLLVASPEEVYGAMLKDQAKAILKEEFGGGGYRRFDVGLPILEQFVNGRFGQDVVVILYGH